MGETWKSWKNYVAELEEDVNAVTPEYPWYGRTVEDMRTLGVDTLKAAVHADIHYRLEQQGVLK